MRENRLVKETAFPRRLADEPSLTVGPSDLTVACLPKCLYQNLPTTCFKHSAEMSSPV